MCILYTYTKCITIPTNTENKFSQGPDPDEGKGTLLQETSVFFY